MRVSDRLKDFISDDSIRARAALASLTKSGEEAALREKISQSIDQHLLDLETERLKAKVRTSGAALALAEQLKNQAASLETEVSSIDEQMASFRDSINRLLAKKLDNTAAIASLNDKVEAAKKEAESFDTIDKAAAAIKDDLTTKKDVIGVLCVKPAS
jgi:FtsZ-binding cell division protein ZapB